MSMTGLIDDCSGKKTSQWNAGDGGYQAGLGNMGEVKKVFLVCADSKRWQSTCLRKWDGSADEDEVQLKLGTMLAPR